MTMTDQDKVAALVAEVQRVAAENPDFVYKHGQAHQLLVQPPDGGQRFLSHREGSEYRTIKVATT